ncbi:hypothetical protein BKP35_16645 [Anaerobacillus arseniciselenatis]|uniref:histidine kinase n=1 Tax=Anaerobacillus arseniciselenatis TaxID=85682 RepID=A0A1S2L9Y5_9BACI|nr:HAMP domain-containing sensor histidine kinase [Anaerobacillus arseniciselenatis]OIJ09299.1 hypothetical protein BKP35_16645 [Anaerobacillus arseniciselenatis]
MKLQYQLWLIFSGLFIVVCFAVYVFISNTYEQRLQVGYEQLSVAQGYTILERIKNTYPNSPNRSVGYLRTYSEQTNSRLIMLDDEKRVYADSYQQLEKNARVNLDILNRQNIAPSSLFIKTDSFGYVQYTIFSFETVDSEGYLLMVQGADQLYDELTSFRIWMIRTLLVAVFAFFFITYFVSSWFSRPIRKMIAQLKKITPQKREFSVKYQRQDEIKELIDATQSMVAELNHYDERQRRFLSTSSHELKTPLATMQFILENLPYVRDNERTYREYIQDLSFQIQKMKQMVDQLLHINRLWDQPLKLETLYTQDVKDYLLQTFQHIARQKQISLDFNFDQVKLYVDRTLFLRGLENLVSNAIRYSDQTRVVKISIKDDNQQIKISVCDNGIGISIDDLPHIFEPFYRSNDATTWNQEGSGLGLTIVKQMVEMHKGRINVDSEKNIGTCIYILLPKG